MADVTAFLQEGFQGAAHVLRTLVCVAKLDAGEAADFCQVSRETFRRWLHDRPAPAGAVRLLAIRAGFCPWPGWEKFYHCPTDGKLYHHDLRYGFGPSDVVQLHWMRGELETLRSENQRLRLAVQVAERKSAAESRSTLPGAEPTERTLPGRFGGGRVAEIIPFPAPGVPAAPVHLPSTSERVRQVQSARHVLGHLRRWLVRENRM